MFPIHHQPFPGFNDRVFARDLKYMYYECHVLCARTSKKRRMQYYFIAAAWRSNRQNIHLVLEQTMETKNREIWRK